MNRRRFLETSGRLACGFTAAAGIIAFSPTSVNADASEQGPNIFGPREGFSPQIGTLVSMLNWMRGAILQPVQGLSVAQLDYLHDAKANTVGALLLHLAAIERLYQVNTFEGKKWGDVDEATKKRFNDAAVLGDAARKNIKRNKLSFYLNTLKEVRERTLAELRQRDDAWLMAVDRDWSWGPTNNYCKWFHVCEHESNHNGQIKWLIARLPG